MPVSCTPDDLAEDIRCLSEQPTNDLLAQIVFVLCQIAGEDCDPDTLAPGIKCLSNWTRTDLLAAMVFLLCQLAEDT